MHHIKPVILKADGKKRSGKGFSPEELKKAGLNLGDARRMQIPADFRRRTVHDENVEALKAFAAKVKAEAKPKPKPEPEPEAKPAAKKKKEKAKK
jgi:large subunit ribosomal protein L13e